MPPLLTTREAGVTTFTDVDAGLVAVSYGRSTMAAWGDYDNDGALDIALAGYVNASPGSAAKLYHNDSCLPDLKINKLVEPAMADAGGFITYTLGFTNMGYSTASQVVITDRIPVEVTNVAVVGHSGAAITQTGSAPDLAWEVQDLGPHQGGIIIIQAKLSASLPLGTIVTNTAFITAASQDSQPRNNHSAAAVSLPFRISATNPAAQALLVPVTVTLNATFNMNVNAGTITTATFAAQGVQSGLVTGTLSYDDPSRTLTLDPVRSFHAGEVVRASATAGIHSGGGLSLLPYQWQFTAGPFAPLCDVTFTEAYTGLTGVHTYQLAAWGDYDNDGDLDLVLAGYDGVSDNYVSKVYRNNGDDTFSGLKATGLTGVGSGSAAWGDYDNDSRLDILLVGYSESGDEVSKIYHTSDCNDVAIAKTVTPAAATPGGAVTYTLAFANLGRYTASGVVITDAIPVSVTNTSVISSGVVITQRAGARYAWDVQDLAAGEGGIITITGVLSASLSPGAIVVNSATISVTSADSNLSDNTSSASVAMPPAADFTAAPRSGLAPLAVAFSDASLGQVTGRLWEFGDGATSAEQNPVHVYNSPGVYTVTLSASNAGGSDSETKVEYILVTPLTLTFDVTGSGVYTLSDLCSQLTFAPNQTGSLTTITATFIYTYPTMQGEPRPLPRQYNLEGDGSGFTATLSLCYDHADLVAASIPLTAESSLQMYRNMGGSAWISYTSSVYTDTNRVTSTITGFSAWAIGTPMENHQPTAIGLYKLGWADPRIRPIGVWVGLGALGAGVWWVRRRRKSA